MWVNSGLVCRWRLIGQYWELVLTSHILISISISISISIQIFIPIPLHSAASCCHCHSSAPQYLHHGYLRYITLFHISNSFHARPPFCHFPLQLGLKFIHFPEQSRQWTFDASDQNSQYSETAQVRCVSVPRPYPVLVQTRRGRTKVIETQLCFVRLVWRCYWIVLITV